ncbi:MAG: cupin domain-containing protein [Sphingopyxis sp.]|nr:cupin domain-containing protein [Sphingopyxis sp.]
MSVLLALLFSSTAAPAVVVIDEATTVREEAPPHGAIGMSTAYRISDSVPAPRSFEFRKRALHVGAAIGLHPIDHDEIYYVLSGTGIVRSDGEEKELKAGTAAWLYKGATVGIRQTGSEPLVLIIAYPNRAAE